MVDILETSFGNARQVVCNVCYEKFVTHLLLYTVANL